MGGWDQKMEPGQHALNMHSMAGNELSGGSAYFAVM